MSGDTTRVAARQDWQGRGYTAGGIASAIRAAPRCCRASPTTPDWHIRHWLWWSGLWRVWIRVGGWPALLGRDIPLPIGWRRYWLRVGAKECP